MRDSEAKMAGYSHGWKHAEVALGGLDLLAKVASRLHALVGGRARQLTVRHVRISILHIS